jgi:AraC-like DNA-binding protein
MLEAMERLALADAPVLDVALAVGFEGASAFTHAFKRFTGVTPSAWRAAST